MRKIIKKYCIVLRIDLLLRETFQNNPFVAFKRDKVARNYRSSDENGNVFKTHLENRKGNVNLVTQVNHHYVTSGPLVLVHSEVSKRYTIFHKFSCKGK